MTIMEKWGIIKKSLFMTALIIIFGILLAVSSGVFYG